MMSTDILNENTVWLACQGEFYEVLDAQSGARLAALNEVARVRSPRGNIFNPDAVKTPRVTYELLGSGGERLFYVDRAESLKLYVLPPQTVLLGSDGVILCRVDYEQHSPMNGGGKVQHDEAGVAFIPAVRLLDAQGHPLGDVLVVQTPWHNEKPLTSKNQDARLARWVDMDGAILAERWDGVLYFAKRLPDAWRTLVLGSFISMMLEYNLPFGKGKGPESVPEAFPGHAELHAAYDEFQLKRVDLWKQPQEGGREFPILRAGVQSYRQERIARIAAPFIAALLVVNLIMRFVN